MRSGLKLALVTLPLALVGFGVLAFIVSRNPPPERNELAERATAVRVIVAKSQAVSPLLTGYGIVTPARTFEAIAEVGGTPEHVNPSLEKAIVYLTSTVTDSSLNVRGLSHVRPFPAALS